jgi:hypothetical protein
MKNTTITLMVVNSLPLPLYPFLFMASVMGLSSPDATVLTPFVIFMWISLLYPLPWLVALIGAVVCLVMKHTRWALWQQLAISLLLLVKLTLFAISMATTE